MKTEHVIRVRDTKEVVYVGSSLDDCKKVMRQAFFDHIDKGLDMNSFPLHAITIHTPEPGEMDYESEDYNDFHSSY